MLFPPDTLTAILDTTGSGGTTCGVIIATSSDPQTIVYERIINDSNIANAQILAGSQTLLETETNSNAVDSFAPIQFQNQAITCTRGNNVNAHFIVSYVPRGLSATSTIEYTQINNQPISITSTDTTSPVNIQYIVILGIALVTIALFSLIRLLFMRKRHL